MHIALDSLARTRHSAISLNNSAPSTCFLPFSLNPLEFRKGVQGILLREDPKDLVNLLEKTAELSGEPLVYHRV